MTSRLLLSLGAGATALVAACSSSAGYGSGSGSSSASSAPAATSPVVVSVRSGVLVGPDGHALYENTLDTASHVTCTGACAGIWPPLSGTVKPGTGVDAAAFATVHRPDGSVQATYDGHPLYAFSGDKSAGATSGDGIADGGGTWHVVREGGAAPTSPGSSSPSSQGGGGGYGY